MECLVTSGSIWWRRAAATAVAVAALASAAPAAPAAAGHHGDSPVFRPPVDAPVSDPFRPPQDRYGAGNRGVEYDTEPGQAVRAAAAGTVVFAGAVAGSLHVTVDHGGGVVSSYSHLQRIAVRAGAVVVQGQAVGVTGERLHFGVRVEGDYVDPAEFAGVRRVRVRLVPVRGLRWSP
ncbi:MAG: M23 family metallopeptidase [Acidimicrobiaceae bacterium]|nr:M23 family metallopeptidase [Acidimicrobiaceae bacterium]